MFSILSTAADKITIQYNGNLVDSIFSLNGAFTEPSEKNPPSFVFNGLTPETTYELILHTLNMGLPGEVLHLEVFTTTEGSVTPNLIFNNITTVTHNSIELQIINPESFNQEFVIVNNGQVVPQLSILDGGILSIAGLTPDTFYSIQHIYYENAVLASYIVKTSVDPLVINPPVDPPVDPESPNPNAPLNPEVGVGVESGSNSGLSDIALLGIIFGSIFGFFILYNLLYMTRFY
jgi:hypothetical protein